MMPLKSARFQIIPPLDTLLFSCALLLVKPMEATERTAELEFGFTNLTFYGVNQNDAEGAFKVFVSSLGKTRGYQLNVKTHVFDDIASFRSYIHSRNLQLIVIPALDFVSMNIESIMEPLFVPKVNGRVRKEYLLLVRRDREFQDLNSLRSKSINIMASTGTRLAQIWISRLLEKNGIKNSDQFFGIMKETEKIALTILPVFFGNVDGCIVNRAGFEMMAELNPQIGMQLKVLTSSESFLETIICVSRSDWEKPIYREDAISALRQLHNEVEGRQILTLFKIDQLAAYDPSYIENLKTLVDSKAKEEQTQPSTNSVRNEATR